MDKKHCTGSAINRNIVPTVQVAVQMYSGTLTQEQAFGRIRWMFTISFLFHFFCFHFY